MDMVGLLTFFIFFGMFLGFGMAKAWGFSHMHLGYKMGVTLFSISIALILIGVYGEDNAVGLLGCAIAFAGFPVLFYGRGGEKLGLNLIPRRLNVRCDNGQS